MSKGASEPQEQVAQIEDDGEEDDERDDDEYKLVMLIGR